ncbi:uncharacterized protein LY89DRAFT_781936 [Mollisia scopiformis]|uniref:Wax synthase domain-containing protein n=1 Tax=Mollisia scopiformis TaxID=149040 RepID=A0A194XCC1_MOLSC|nr:uncharacterized protein LY89DRAFT_781936 [Mollisia scopiformis]KUJ17809.1 hypothetical protein LY89DRAFT_781936 [Mollisia scopiformis]
MAYMIRAPWAAFVGGYSTSFFLQYLDVALLSRYSFEEVDLKKSETSPAITLESFLPRIKWAISLLVNFRFIDTSQSLKNIPQFSNGNPAYIPSRKRFLCETADTAAVSYLVLDLLTSTGDPEMSSKYLSLANIPFFNRLATISGIEILICLSATICLGISMNYVQGGIYSIMGFFSVLFGISSPKSWPPFYGHLLQASSLRKFLGFILSDLYELDPKAPLTRYLRLVIIFLLSGLMHLCIDIASGIPLQDSGAFNFFLVQIVGILMEDAFSKIRQALFNPDNHQSLAKRLFGCVRVLTFLSWSVPVYLYPMLSRSGPEHSTIPFSIVNKLRHGTW